MKFATLCLCAVVPLLASGCAGKRPHADMTENYPRKPFAVRHNSPPSLAGGNFIMPPGIPPVSSSRPSAPPSIQSPIKGSGENGPPPAYPSLTDTEVTYGH